MCADSSVIRAKTHLPRWLLLAPSSTPELSTPLLNLAGAPGSTCQRLRSDLSLYAQGRRLQWTRENQKPRLPKEEWEGPIPAGEETSLRLGSSLRVPAPDQAFLEEQEEGLLWLRVRSEKRAACPGEAWSWPGCPLCKLPPQCWAG